MGVGRAIAMRSVTRGGKKKKQPTEEEAAAQQAPPRHASPMIAWAVLVAVWFLTIYPIATNLIPGIVGLIAAVIGFFVLKAALLNKLREILP